MEVPFIPKKPYSLNHISFGKMKNAFLLSLVNLEGFTFAYRVKYTLCEIFSWKPAMCCENSYLIQFSTIRKIYVEVGKNLRRFVSLLLASWSFYSEFSVDGKYSVICSIVLVLFVENSCY